MRSTVAAAVFLAACSSKGAPAHRASDPEAMFDAVRPALERAVAANGAFPVAIVDHLPLGACCDNTPDHRCTPTELAGQPWIDAARLPPTFNFQLSYASDGKTATVHAIGDADCDMDVTDTELGGEIKGKTVVWTVTKNADKD